MKFFTSNKSTFQSVLKKYFSFKTETKSLDPLYETFEGIKRVNFTEVLVFLKENKEIAENFGYYLRNLFEGKPFNLSLTEANILSENGFVPELRKRVLNSILPPVENENSIWFLVDYVSVRPGKDLKYLKNIPENELIEAFDILGISRFIRKKKVIRELVFSANILAWRAIGNALDIGVMNMVPEYKNFDNPFLALQDEMDLLKNEFRKNPEFYLSAKNEHYKQIKIYLEQCLTFVELAFRNSAKYGISSKTNQSLLKIRQQVARISEVINLLVINSEDDEVKNSISLIFNILEYKSHKNDVAELFNDNTRLISHLITNHTAETGVHYITSGIKDYMKMFWKASGGGVIVGVLCILKMLYSYSDGSEFSHAFMYAFNYAMGFVMIYLMGFTLATKQPAMTAATMARVLSDIQATKSKYVDFAHLLAKLIRTQFIAFVGNVLWAFPVSLAIIYGLDVLFNQNFATDKASTLLRDLDPFESKALLHASIAGFYLFISGIIAGNVGNNSVYYQMPQRIAKNPLINKILGERFAKSLSKYYSRNWAGIVSNVWFGIFLGATGPLGKFLGIDIDIRHITFAAGNFALGLYGKEFSVDMQTFWICFVTVFLIGFFNFIVSFGLSMVLAFRSRKVNLSEGRAIIVAVFRYFIKNPFLFFIPIKSKALDVRSREIMEKSSTKS